MAKSQKNLAEGSNKNPKKQIKVLTEYSNFQEMFSSDDIAGYWEWDFGKEKNYISAYLKSLLGYNTDDHILWVEVLHPDDIAPTIIFFREFISERRYTPFNMEFRLKHKDGKLVWINSRGKIIEWDQDDKAKKIVGIHVDITDKKEAEMAMLKALELEKKKRDLEQFSYVISNDLKEPIYSIKAFASLLQNEIGDDLPQELQFALQSINKSALKLESMIRSLSDYYLLGRKLVFTEVNLNEVLKQSLLEVNSLVEKKNAKITSEDLPTIKGTKFKLNLLFQLLLTNALQYSRVDVQPEIHVSTISCENKVRIAIRDNGIGISEKDQKSIFKIFTILHQLDPASNQRGIGLTLAEKIVQLHRGEIKVKSKLNVGTTVYLILPLE